MNSLLYCALNFKQEHNLMKLLNDLDHNYKVSMTLLQVVFDDITHPMYVFFIGWLQRRNIVIDCKSLVEAIVPVSTWIRCIKLGFIPKQLSLSLIAHISSTQPDYLMNVLAMNGFEWSQDSFNLLNSNIDLQLWVSTFFKYQPETFFRKYIMYLTLNHSQHCDQAYWASCFNSEIERLTENVQSVVDEFTSLNVSQYVLPFIGCRRS